MEGWIRFPRLCGVRGLAHAVTTRAGGASRGPFASLNLGASTGDDPSRVEANRRLVGEALGASTVPVFPRQAHGARIAVVAGARGGAPSDVGEAIDACTYDDRDRFYSQRRDGARTGRHALVAMWT